MSGGAAIGSTVSGIASVPNRSREIIPASTSSQLMKAISSSSRNGQTGSRWLWLVAPEASVFCDTLAVSRSRRRLSE